jgi:hypothetical protein
MDAPLATAGDEATHHGDDAEHAAALGQIEARV